MTLQYLRQVSVTIGGVTLTSDGDSGPRMRFDTQQFVSATPAHCNLYITNLSKETYNKIAKENQDFTLSVGYRDGGPMKLFAGQTRQVRLFREDVTDTITHVIATSSGNARNFALVNKTLAAGHTHDDRAQEAVKAFQAFGVTIGHVDKLGGPKFSRGFAAFGMAHAILRETCLARKAQWFNHNGTFHLLKNEKTLPGGTVVLNSETGLVGIPEQTLQGVQFRALCNPLIGPGTRVQIDQRSVTRAAINPSYSAEGNNQLLAASGLMGVQADGQYKVLKVSHSGDTRGNPFFTDGICVGLNADSASLRSIGISDDYPDTQAGARN